MSDHHRPCACGAELEDECPRCAHTNPLGSMRVTRPEPCPGCPFAACLGCQWHGSNDVGTQGILWDNGGTRTAPGVASTNTEGLALQTDVDGRRA